MTAIERHILIVDDSPEDSATIRRFLSRDKDYTYRFDEESTGLGAIGTFRSSPPDCLLLDYDLPDMNGLEVLSEIVDDPKRSLTPIVMLTGRGAESVAVVALKRGAHDYLVKGQYNAEILRQTIDDAITRVSTQREIERQQDELRRLYGETREAELRKDDFLAMLAHELRNPLATVLNASRILSLRQVERSDDQQLVGMIERQVRHLCRLVDDLLDVSRITQGKIQLRLESRTLNQIVATATESLQSIFEHRRQAFLLTMPDREILLHVDPTRIEQVIVNLLNNASKYTDPGGTISLVVEHEGAQAVVTVRDNGVGISPEMLPRVFDLFSQAENSLDRSQGGLGIGLTLVRTLVQMHGGEVSARSEGLGHGSEFTVRLPIVEVPAARDEPIGPTDPETGVRKQARVLVVDDNVHAAQSLSMLIQMWEHQTELAHNGTDAIESALRFEPDLILLDIGLPGRDGYSVAEEMRRLPSLRDKLLVAMTGYGRESDLRRSREAGFDHHLVKPLDFDDLERMLADLDEARRQFGRNSPDNRPFRE